MNAVGPTGPTTPAGAATPVSVGAPAGAATASGAITPTNAATSTSLGAPANVGTSATAETSATAGGASSWALSGTVSRAVALNTPGRGIEALGIVVAAVGSRSADANLRTAAVARRLSESTGLRTEICFATVEPGISAAVERLRARGARRVVVAPWFLAPGLLTDRLHAAAPDIVHADIIGAHPALTDVVWARYDSATAPELELSA
nr:CbiX/SirB N-terminal domain-containing protein [Nocardia caishijiensis]